MKCCNATIQNKKNILEYALQNVAISYHKIKYNHFKKFAILEMFFFLQIFHQLVSNIAKNENLIYLGEEIFQYLSLTKKFGITFPPWLNIIIVLKNIYIFSRTIYLVLSQVRAFLEPWCSLHKKVSRFPFGMMSSIVLNNVEL